MPVYTPKEGLEFQSGIVYNLHSLYVPAGELRCRHPQKTFNQL